MAGDLYDTDIVAWSAQQAELLRHAARGERVNGLDWPNLIEEIESVGRSEVHSVESLLRQALVHLLKLGGWPGHDATSHWRGEIVGFLADAERRFAPSMWQAIDLAGVYRSALRQVTLLRIDGTAPRPLPPACPFALDDLLADAPEIGSLLARLTAAAEG
jgi:hypothetical protein